MATWYVDSTATGTNAGTSWTNACTTLAAAIALSSAGDDFNVSSAHAETSTSAINLVFKGTAASPNRAFSCGKTHSPAKDSDLAAGGSLTLITNTGLSINIAGYAYVYGLSFNASTGGSNINLGASTSSTASESSMTFEACTFVCGINGSGSTLNMGVGFGGYRSDFVFTNTKVSLYTSSAGINVQSAFFTWKNTSNPLNGTTPTSVLGLANAAAPSFLKCIGVDFSALGSGKTIVGTLGQRQTCQLIDCKLGSSVTVSVTSNGPAGSCDLINSDSAATGYRQERYRYEGTLTTSTAVYNLASDGVTPIAWKVVATANAKRQIPFDCFEIVQWVARGTYSATTVAVTSATSGLTNADVWVDAQVLDNASFPISDAYSSGPATQLTTGSALTAGSAWAAPLGGSPSNYLLNVPSFTVAIDGYVRFTVKVAKASTTVYIDPNVQVA